MSIELTPIEKDLKEFHTFSKPCCGSALDPDFLSVPDYRITSTQHRSNPVLNQGINPLIPASPPVADRQATALDTNQPHHTPVDTSNRPVDQCPAVNRSEPLKC